MGESSYWIKFLGTAGARFVVMKQLRSSAGTWLRFGNVQALLDPGPGTLVRCAASRPRLDPSKLDAIFLSHRHLDHSNDVNVMIEAMTDGGFKQRGHLFAPADALDDDPVVLQYVRPFLEEIQVLKEGGTYLFGDVKVRTPVRHEHTAETYGLIFETPGLPSVAFVVDTRYFDGLVDAYAGVDVLILNVVRYDRRKPQPNIMHLNVEDAERLISEIQPRVAVLTHFGMTMVRAKPWVVAEELSQATGVRVGAASDGMTLDLESLADF